MLTHGSLFAGIGGFDLGFEWAGIKTLWQIEIDGYCRKVLAKHWSDVEQFKDIKDCGQHNLKEVNIISGGFPCQDISVAGKRAGINGSRSGLWAEMHRIIGELRPRYAVIENVPNLISLGLERVLCDLAEIGYDAEWQVIGADDVGAPHRRKRIWIVAYSNTERCSRSGDMGEERQNPLAEKRQTKENNKDGQEWQCEPSKTSEDVSNPKGTGRPSWVIKGQSRGYGEVANTKCQRLHPGYKHQEGQVARCSSEQQGWWSVEPDVGRVAHGIPSRVDRLKGLGNAIVPQIAEIIGRMIIEASRPSP